MTSVDYIFVSFVLMLGVSVLNLRLARESFGAGEDSAGWISSVLSAVAAAGALFNLTQLINR